MRIAPDNVLVCLESHRQLTGGTTEKLSRTTALRRRGHSGQASRQG